MAGWVTNGERIFEDCCEASSLPTAVLVLVHGPILLARFPPLQSMKHVLCFLSPPSPAFQLPREKLLARVPKLFGEQLLDRGAHALDGDPLVVAAFTCHTAYAEAARAWCGNPIC